MKVYKLHDNFRIEEYEVVGETEQFLSVKSSKSSLVLNIRKGNPAGFIVGTYRDALIRKLDAIDHRLRRTQLESKDLRHKIKKYEQLKKQVAKELNDGIE